MIMKKIYFYIVLIALLISFFIGRWTISKTAKMEIIRGETIRDTVWVSAPISEQTPKVETVIKYLPLKPDTVRIDSIEYVQIKIDTAKLIAEYITQRKYNILLFDNENGTLSIMPTVQFNQLSESIPYEFTPTRIVTTKQRERVLIPFVSVSCLTDGNNNQGFGMGAGGGFFYYNMGLEYLYLLTDDRHAVSVKLKF